MLFEYNDAWTLNLTSYAWNELTTNGTKPRARHGHSSILWNGQMVMFGGSDGDGTMKNDTWSLDLNIRLERTHNVWHETQRALYPFVHFLQWADGDVWGTVKGWKL